jgi:N-methylhydantoinase A
MRMRFLDIDRVNEIFAALERQAAEEFRAEGFTEPPLLTRTVDVRYVGQNWELGIDVPVGRVATLQDFLDVGERFASEHERFYGYDLPGEELEILTFKLSAVGSRHELPLPTVPTTGDAAPIGRRAIVFADSLEPVETPLFRRETLPAGTGIAGPALIGQVDSMTLLPPGSDARVDEFGNLHVTI